MRRLIAVACLLLAAAPASAGTKLIVTGRGWGHGVGMSQWGAYGFARHGWSWQRILAHYYPGTQIGNAPLSTVRVLLAAHASRPTIACAGGISVSDATGRSHSLQPGSYTVGAKLRLPVGRKRVAVQRGREHRDRFAIVPANRAMHAPVVFDCPTAPLLLNGRPYHGRLVLRRAGGGLSVVNSVPLDEYLRGVVPGEMPFRWSIAALAAQAVAARSYALATLKPGAHFDLFADTRSQVYGGILFETPRTDIAVAKTAGKVLLWHGHVATTFFFSTSGGHTADVSDVWPQYGHVPYLRSVDDPYDAISPKHAWGPIVLDADAVARKLHVPLGDFSVALDASDRVADVRIGSRQISGFDFSRALGLNSTWFSVGELSLAASRPQVRYGQKLSLSLRAEAVGDAVLQRRIGAGAWKQIAKVSGARTVTVEPQGNTLYRLSAERTPGPVATVAVVPRLRVEPTGRTELSGSVEPVVRGGVTVLHLTRGAWRTVAHPQIGADGTFDTPVRLRPGAYRVVLDGTERFAGAETSLELTARLLASLGQ